jgi:hypothetical protein
MAEQQPNIGLFSQKPPMIPQAAPETVNQINSLGRRLRMVEESLSSSRKKSDLDEQNNILSFRKMNTEMQAINEELREMRFQLKSFKEDMIKIIRELQGTAKKEDVTRIEKYVNLWEPSKFVTQNEVPKIVAFVIEQQKREEQRALKSQQQHSDSENYSSVSSQTPQFTPPRYEEPKRAPIRFPFMKPSAPVSSPHTHEEESPQEQSPEDIPVINEAIQEEDDSDDLRQSEEPLTTRQEILAEPEKTQEKPVIKKPKKKLHELF